MRKSIFLTVTLALFLVGLNVKVNAQDCTATKHKPTAGVPYTYQVAVTSTVASATDKIYNWYVTPDVNLLDETKIYNGATNDFFKVNAEAGISTYNTKTSAGTTDKIKLEWKPDAIAEDIPFYLVLKYSENNGTCVVNNLKVMEIKPLNNFKINITPVKDAAGTAFGATESATVCVADVSGATVVPGASDQGTATSATRVVYTYGENTLYYKVNAKGFKGEWTPEIQLPALETGQKYVSASWKQGATSGTFTGLNQTAAVQTLKAVENAKIEDAVNGSDIIVTVVIENGTYEHINEQTLAVKADGTGVLKAGSTKKLNDQKDNCTEATIFERETSSKISARPKIDAAAGGFLITVQ